MSIPQSHIAAVSSRSIGRVILENAWSPRMHALLVHTGPRARGLEGLVCVEESGKFAESAERAALVLA